MSSLARLRALSNLISSSIDEIERHCNTNNVVLPSLDEVFTAETEAGAADPAIAKPSAIVVSAASQLIAMVQPPVATLMDVSCAFHRSSALQAILISNTVECIREGDKNGTHVKDIAARVNLNDVKLARLLRYLSNQHIFREVEPNVFSNNRLSSMLDTGKPLSELQAKPLDRHTGTTGMAAMIELFTDEFFKGSAYVPETLVDPESRDSLLPTKSGFNRAFRTDLHLFSWLELPENLHRLKRFATGLNSMDDKVVEAFDWNGLAKGSLVVDVGGGIGITTIALRRAYPHLRYLIQERAPVVQEGEKFWKSSLPEALETGSVKFEVHDFMQPQPIKDASVFILRMILHGWVDPSAEKILRHLREAATPETKLVVVENIISYTCPDTNDYGNIPGAKLPLPPAPLLANLGNSTVYVQDLIMLIAMNSLERTVLQFQELFQRTGWKLARIYRSEGITLPTIIAIPN